MADIGDATQSSRQNSTAAFEKAKRVMPGGVSSPDRAFDAVGGSPLFIKSAAGCTITDIDGNSFVDYVAGQGTLIAGHANERVVAAVSKAIGRGSSFATSIEAEAQLAGTIVGALPSIEMIRFTNSGTEAVMTAVRLARAATKRDEIVLCDGCYHGHADSVLPEAKDSLFVKYNDLAATKKLFDMHGGKIAAMLVEPVAGNMGVVEPASGYLAGLRELCDKHGTLLIFDEVMTGFRVAWGGAQIRYHVRPDITCLGKIIGGGMPIGAFGASTALMEKIEPVGDVFHGGTFSGNPVSMAAGLATLEILAEPGVYETLEERSEKLGSSLSSAADKHKANATIHRVGSMMSIGFKDLKRFAKFFHAMLDDGVYLAPNRDDSIFVSLAHDDAAIDKTVEAADAAFASLT